MKQNLTLEEIRFIDNYLKNSGVDFVDVRTEMVDHVASEIENRLEENNTSDFYEEFKIYMVQHKNCLLKNAGKYRWSVDKKVLKEVLKNLINLQVLTPAVVIAIILFAVDIQEYLNSTQISIAFYAVLLMLAFIPILLYRKIKLSFLNRIGVLGNLPFLIAHNIILTEGLSFSYYQVTYSILFWILISFGYTSICFAREYKQKYQIS